MAIEKAEWIIDLTEWIIWYIYVGLSPLLPSSAFCHGPSLSFDAAWTQQSKEIGLNTKQFLQKCLPP